MPKIAEIEYTPNPNAKRFVLKEALSSGPARAYENAVQAEKDPLARDLFAIPHVTEVYYVDRYLTVVQDGQAPWGELERLLAVPIRAADPAVLAQLIVQSATPKRGALMSPEDTERLAHINELLDERVRPALQMDGGGLEVLNLVGNQLTFHYQGACGTCPSAISGTLAGIEALLRTIEPNIELVAV